MKKVKQNVFFVVLLIAVISCKNNKNKDKENLKKTAIESYNNKDVYEDTKTLYERFEIKSSLNTNVLDVCIDTDLPDNLKMSVSVNRSYWEKGDLETSYWGEYFSEDATVGEWKKAHKIVLNKQILQTNIIKKQNELALSSIDLDIAKISDSITIYASVMSANSPEPNFKNGKYGQSEITLYHPLNGNIKTESEYGNVQALKVGKTYSISESTPLMDEFEPADPIACIENMKKIVKNDRIKILKIAFKKNTPWYKVKVSDKNNKNIGIGWINSIALWRQELYIIK